MNKNRTKGKIEDLFAPDGDDETSTSDETSISIEFNNLMESLNEVGIPLDVIPYSEITRLIYDDMLDKKELLDSIDGNLMQDFESYQRQHDPSKEVTRIFMKITEHVSLSIIQRNHISDSLSNRIGKISESARKTEMSVTDINTELKEAIISAENAHEKADKLIVQFIAILGIFAAIMMGTMGSFQSFTSIFSNAENIPIGKTLSISAAGASGVSLILFLLLHAISKLTSFSISNCDCSNKRIGSISASLRLRAFGGSLKSKCTCSLFNKYPTIFIVNYLFYYIAFTGFIFMYFNFYNYFNMKFWLHPLIIGGFYFIATIILVFVHRYIIDKRSDEGLLNKFIKDIRKTPKYFKDSY